MLMLWNTAENLRRISMFRFVRKGDEKDHEEDESKTIKQNELTD